MFFFVQAHIIHFFTRCGLNFNVNINLIFISLIFRIVFELEIDINRKHWEWQKQKEKERERNSNRLILTICSSWKVNNYFRPQCHLISSRVTIAKTFHPKAKYSKFSSNLRAYLILLFLQVNVKYCNWVEKFNLCTEKYTMFWVCVMNTVFSTKRSIRPR